MTTSEAFQPLSGLADLDREWQHLSAQPVLLYNLCGDSTFEPQPQVVLRPSPFGFRPPPIPVARTATVARVASPASTQRAYQPLFLDSLKAFFEDKKRLVKKGDIIAVSIDSQRVSLFAEPEDDKSENDDSLRPALVPGLSITQFTNSAQGHGATFTGIGHCFLQGHQPGI